MEQKESFYLSYSYNFTERQLTSTPLRKKVLFFNEKSTILRCDTYLETPFIISI